VISVITDIVLGGRGGAGGGLILHGCSCLDMREMTRVFLSG
jgi:hypothetical protein